MHVWLKSSSVNDTGDSFNKRLLFSVNQWWGKHQIPLGLSRIYSLTHQWRIAGFFYTVKHFERSNFKLPEWLVSNIDTKLSSIFQAWLYFFLCISVIVCCFTSLKQSLDSCALFQPTLYLPDFLHEVLILLPCILQVNRIKQCKPVISAQQE